jgi:cellulose synthase/poly-beta-1,6-N-acetylglucosamine synthase-like glycosyltransferase
MTLIVKLIILFIILQTVSAILLQWTAVVAALGLLLRKRKKHEMISDRRNRFAVVICARNEEKVLPFLLESLSRQNYPKDYWHAYVIADHCTDSTASVAKHYPLATVWERNEGPRTGKGDVLNWGIDRLLSERAGAYDAILVFDADNIASPDFMVEMNKVLNEGADVVQGNRLAGKPFRSTVTKWYAIYWTAFSFLYSYPRHVMNLSPFLTGTGFAVRTSVLQKYGWKTSTMTEDVEYSIQTCLRGDRISFAINAICYDEQPHELKVAFRQLCRWCTGTYQILGRYFRKWCHSMKEKPTIRKFDNLALLLTGPFSIISLFMTIILNVLIIIYFQRVRLLQIVFILLSIAATYMGTWLTTRYVHLKLKDIMSGWLTFPLFLMLFTFCSFWSLFKPQRRWTPIEHDGIKRTD